MPILRVLIISKMFAPSSTYVCCIFVFVVKCIYSDIYFKIFITIQPDFSLLHLICLILSIVFIEFIIIFVQNIHLGPGFSGPGVLYTQSSEKNIFLLKLDAPTWKNLILSKQFTSHRRFKFRRAEWWDHEIFYYTAKLYYSFTLQKT